MKITPKIIAACKKAGACEERIAYKLYEFNQEWFFWLTARTAVKTASDAYDAAVKTASDAYDAAVKTASDAYNAAVKPAYDAYDADVKTARDAYYAAVKTALINALRKTFA